MAFRIAGALAFKDAARRANPVVLEPFVTAAFRSRESYLEFLLADISALCGRIEEIATARGLSMVRATVPLRSMLGNDGEAVQTMTFLRYEPLPLPPDKGNAAGAGVRMPRSPVPGTGPTAGHPDLDWT
jgi:elongation factor G